MAGRALLGVVIGGFWSMSAATAMRLVPERPGAQARLAIFNGGNALATVVAAPLGSYLGSVVGWRGAFLCLVPVAADRPGLAVGQPAGHEGRSHAHGSGNVFRLLKRREVALGMAGCGAFFMGQFALFTYLRPFLETVTRVNVSTLSLILLVIGVAGFIGTMVIGRFLTRGVYRPLIAIPIGMAVIALALIRLRRLGRGRHRAARPVGAAGDRGAGGLVELDRASHAQERRGRRRADGGGDPVGHRDGLDRGGHAVRRQRLPEHLRRKRGGAADRRLPHVSDVTR